MSTTVSPKPGSIDPQVVMPFVAAVRGLFTTMVNVNVTIGRPIMKTAASTSYEVSGVIGFSGQVSGSIAVSFSKTAAITLVEAFAGVRLELTSPDFADAIGELANMVAGQAKRDLGAVASITTPCVIIGQGYSFAPLSGVPCVVIPCTTVHGDFAVEICIKKQTV